MGMQTVSPAPRPDFTRCFGITHMADGGAPIIREPKLLKVGIGVPKGVGIHAYRAQGVWKIAVGAKTADTKVYKAQTRAEAEAMYWHLREKAPAKNFPSKLPYFTFSRQTGDGSLVPDFEAIEAHGDTPQEIDIVFLTDQPLEASYAMWSTAELRCKGDGINALRALAGASGAEEKRLAAEAHQARGEKYFPIVDGCATRGCRFTQGEPPPCKPSGSLKFQLANNLRVGGTAYFHTTGYRSISQLFSSLYTFRTLTGGGDPERGRIAGIPFKMVVRPYQTKHDGKVATQYGVSLEFRAETVAALRTKLIEQATQFRTLISIPGAAPAAIQGARIDESRQLTAGPVEDLPEGIIDDDLGDEQQQAAMMASEFGAVDAAVEETGEPEPSQEMAPAAEFDEEQPDPKAEPIAEKSKERSNALLDKLSSMRAQQQQKPAEENPAAAPASKAKAPEPQGDFF